MPNETATQPPRGRLASTRIGLFGGTFNPIHKGHLGAALDVFDGFDLDRCYLIPSALPPHKRPLGLVSAADRMAMLRLALAAHPGLVVSEVELHRLGPSYTIDTVNHFVAAFPDATLFLMIGLDAFLEIDTWKSYRELFDLIPFIVLSRPGSIRSRGSSDWKILEDYLKSRISREYRMAAETSCLRAPGKVPVYGFQVTPRDISSTAVRRRIGQGRSIRDLVPAEVAAFIARKGYYR